MTWNAQRVVAQSAFLFRGLLAPAGASGTLPQCPIPGLWRLQELRDAIGREW